MRVARETFSAVTRYSPSAKPDGHSLIRCSDGQNAHTTSTNNAHTNVTRTHNTEDANRPTGTQRHVQDLVSFSELRACGIAADISVLGLARDRVVYKEAVGGRPVGFPQYASLSRECTCSSA
ncbi:hypothetical protein AHF37_10596 [Paragonimus kellicotti]|nr:hypothetical protein AHF37_10596 [Paragonimus kellicotti]